MLVRGFQLCTVYSLEVEQTGQGCFKASVSSFFFFFFASAESPQAGGQLFTRRESLTHIHRLLTHLAHLYGREKAKKKKKKMHCWYLELIQLGLTGHEHQHGLPHLPNEIVPFEKASTNVYIPSCSAVDFNYGYKGEGGGKQRT